MRFPFALSAAAIVVIAIAACSGGQQSTFVTPAPVAPAAAGPVTLSGSSVAQSAGTVGAVTATLTYGSGSGTVSVASGASAPAGTIAVTPMHLIRVASSATSPNVYYLTISSTAGATFNLPAVNLTLTTPAVGTFQEAQFVDSKWTNIAVSSANAASGATSVSFPPGKTAVTIPAGGSIYLAFYQGSFPGPTPPGQVTNTAIADTSFEGTAANYGSAVSTTGWTICSITATAPGAVLPSARPFSKFTPVPGSTPYASIQKAGTAVLQTTGKPTPTQNTVPVNTFNQAAQFGGQFPNFNAADFAFNGLCEKVTIPANPVGSIEVFANGTENALADLGFEVNVLDTSGNFVANLIDENQIAVSPPGDQSYRLDTIPNSLLQPYAGQTVELFVGIWTKDGSSSGSTTFGGFYWADDFAIASGPASS